MPPVFLRPGARQRGAGASGSCTDCRAEVFFAQEAGERFGRFFLARGDGCVIMETEECENGEDAADEKAGRKDGG